jgi:uncharacterized membrane protein YdbT with pleckstrin-like domain
MKQFNLYNEEEVGRLKRMYSLGEREKVIAVTHKHPMYLVLMFMVTIFAYALVLLATYLLSPALFNNNTEAVYRTTSFVALFMAVLIGLVFVITTFLYWQTKLIISSENLIQVLQKDLLHTRISRLALTDIEDVTAEQHGLLGTLFDYGNLVIETAGEQANFVFSFCPSPNYIAKELIDAKEDLVSGVNLYDHP